MEPLYTATVTATGGRNGQVKSDNNVLELEVRFPKALGGINDQYTNPEQLFAAGYAACFDSALNGVIRAEKVKTGITTVQAKVSIFKNDTGGFQLAVKLYANIPGLDLEQAKAFTEKAHQVCPYSNAIRNNVRVDLVTTNHD
ncbi:MAG: organic hydroperoxide resistance protein [Flavobacterium lindanitolerans]|uniref:organic hydroperoxide resistance protein n=1 Tax=Flavobacterium lindanitolerans TaxID=428988 RepID=UPI001A5CFD1B|nr:organic hydroperoxide resistance protein [Flavobacterium lindanitolerans]MBL7869953.1 organic hydroperoxide resistance protein [Flavobacterium lindanitolerans]